VNEAIEQKESQIRSLKTELSIETRQASEMKIVEATVQSLHDEKVQ
jgi:hypothetical protein